jgi:hypothetical protein
MIDIRLKYQASAFVQASDIRPTPENITTLIGLLQHMELVPSTFQELGPSSPAPQVRPRFSSPNNEWNILFASNRIDIEKNPTSPDGSNLGDVSEFCAQATDLFRRILHSYKKKANRIALVTTYLLRDMSQKQLAETYLKLFKPTRFYYDYEPFEWNWRSVARAPIQLHDMSEILNAITAINRIQGERGQIGARARVEWFDRVLLQLDINTSGENVEYRFELHHLDSFYDQVLELHELLVQQVAEAIDG